MSVESSWNGLRNATSGLNTSSRANPSRTRILNATIAPFAASGLVQYIFETIELLGECAIHLPASGKAQNQATEWLWTYNNERPNMGIGGMTPAMKLKTAA